MLRRAASSADHHLSHRPAKPALRTASRPTKKKAPAHKRGTGTFHIKSNLWQDEDYSFAFTLSTPCISAKWPGKVQM